MNPLHPPLIARAAVFAAALAALARRPTARGEANVRSCMMPHTARRWGRQGSAVRGPRRPMTEGTACTQVIGDDSVKASAQLRSWGRFEVGCRAHADLGILCPGNEGGRWWRNRLLRIWGVVR
jgi:hypothetical protein